VRIQLTVSELIATVLAELKLLQEKALKRAAFGRGSARRLDRRPRLTLLMTLQMP